MDWSWPYGCIQAGAGAGGDSAEQAQAFFGVAPRPSGRSAWLRTIADWNPVSALAAAIRDLFGNSGSPANGTWTALLLAVFVPLCTRRYAPARS